MPQEKEASSRAAAAATGPAKPEFNRAAVDKAFEALRTYNYGSSRAALVPIDDAVVACRDDAGARKELERRLADLLPMNLPTPAKEFLCRKLVLIGSGDSVPPLSALLADENVSHWARTALEHIPGPEAVKALRESLPKLRGLQKVGVITSLGTRRDAESVPALATLLKDPDAQMAGAAAAALGNVGTPEAARDLLEFRPNAPDALRLVVADACLTCAERLAAADKKAEALAIYAALAGSAQPEHVRLAAKRGMSKATDKK